MYSIPVYHPLVNHFPIAFLLLAGGAALLWLLSGKPFWRQTTSLLTAVGMIGALTAIRTGETMEEFSGGRQIVKQLVERHDDLAHITLYLSVAATLLFVVAAFWSKRSAKPDFPDQWKVRIVIALLVIAAAVFVGWTGHLGGTMTWGEEVEALSSQPASLSPAAQMEVCSWSLPSASPLAAWSA